MAGALSPILTEMQKEIYSRNILVPEIGEKGQARLLSGRVLVIGLGGLGSPALYYLAAAGVGEIGILDGDTVAFSNLQRQILHGRPDVGDSKVESAVRAVSRLNPDVVLRSLDVMLDSDNALDIIAPFDFVIEATDNFESKFLVNDTCVRLGRPFSHAGVLGAFGQAMTILPCRGPCFRCVFEDVPSPGTYDTSESTGVLGCAAGIMGTIQATEAIKYLLGIDELLVGRLLTFDAFKMSFREIRLPIDKRCGICGTLPHGKAE
ncbi:MAG: HesA/MoeB/ThiF family protein [Syntrophobacteraceae bacterium]